MKYLSDLVEGIKFSYTKNYKPDLKIYSLQEDSRIKTDNYLFFAKKGQNIDSHKFIKDAIDNGAKCIIAQYPIENIPQNITYLVAKDYLKAKAKIVNNFYDNIYNKLNIIAITGTNGKTTSTYMLESIFKEAGYKTGIIGTIKHKILDKEVKAINTTPDILQLNKLLYKMKENSVDYVFMEVSSHALELARVEGMKFNSVIFTNLTQDHLDFHKTMQNYFNAKKKILNNLKDNAYIVKNLDSNYFRKIKYTDEITYAINDKDADLIAQDIKTDIKSINYTLKYKGYLYPIKLNLGGLFNVYNSLGVIAASIREGISIEDIKTGLLNLKSVNGRFDLIEFKDFYVIIDYAHTPNGLENLLISANNIKNNKIITVFGAGGDRDKTKRPLMGAIAYKYSDIIIITSDNPRTEDPLKIIYDIKKGINLNGKNVIVIEDRRKAIQKAIQLAKKDDLVIIAGKGHEDYQVIGKNKIHFSDKEEVLKLLNAVEVI